MTLLERVTTLVRANLNDLIDKAEHPEKLLKQVILDMQNQLMQVKTQVAMAIADERVLAQKRKENEDIAAEWLRKAELAVEKGQDDLARAALERSVGFKRLASGFAQQAADQRVDVENLKAALHKLERKLEEAKAQCDLLAARHRCGRTLERASDARMDAGSGKAAATFDRMKDKVRRQEAIGKAKAQVADDNAEERLSALERDQEIEALLAELKSTRKAEK